MPEEFVLSLFERLGPEPIRIDWYGPVTREFRGGCQAAYVTLTCSRIAAELPTGDAAGGGSFDVTVPVSLLRLLRLGDVWTAGKRYGAIGLTRETFRDLAVSEPASEVVPCGGARVVNGGVERFELPYRAFDAHKKHTKAFIARVPISPGRSLLVPSVELARFYFGQSSQLLANIFSGAFADERLYEYKRLDPVTRVANLGLLNDLPRSAAPAIARIAFDKTARRQFERIISTGIAASAGRRAWYPKMGFPFEGRTDLTCEGVWIDRGEDRAFVVHRLVSCTHPFPFEELYVRCGTDNGDGSSRRSRPGGSRHGSHGRRVEANRPFNHRLRSVPVGRIGAPADEVQFPDLENKPVRQVKSKLGGSARVQRSTGAGDSTGQPELGAAGPEAGAGRMAEAGGADTTTDLPLAAPLALQLLVAQFKRLMPELKVRAPWDKGAVARLEVRTPAGMSGGVWLSRFDLFIGEGSILLSALAVVDGDNLSHDNVALMLLSVDPQRPVSEELGQELAPAFWGVTDERERLKGRHVGLRFMTFLSVISWATSAHIHDMVEPFRGLWSDAEAAAQISSYLKLQNN